MDELDDYHSSEDEDYIDDGTAGADEDLDEDGFGGPPLGGGLGGRKRKTSACLSGITGRPGKVWQASKKPKKGAVGAQVLSDDDAEEEERVPPQAAVRLNTNAASTPTRTSTQPTINGNTVVTNAVETPSPSTSNAVPLASSSPASVAASTPIISAHAAASSSSSFSLDAILARAKPGSSPIAASTPGTPVPAPATSAASTSAPGSSQSLTQLLANFQSPKPAAATTKPASTLSLWDTPKPLTPIASHQASAQATLAALLAKPMTPKDGAPKTAATPMTTAGATTSAKTDALSDDKIVVKELTSYAGEVMEITKTIVRGSVEDRVRQKASKDNLASLVASLTAKKSMSTLAKSQVDWQISKDEEGDTAELEKATKNGYVDKQAFLAKTDLRQFELEKAARNVKRRQDEASKKGIKLANMNANSADGVETREISQDDDDGPDEPETTIEEAKEPVP